MQGGYLSPVQSDATIHFTEALTTDQISANYDLQLPTRNPLTVRAITLISLQNLSWELWLFDRAVNLTNDPMTDRFLAMWQFPEAVAAGPGFTVTPAAGGGANTLFRYYVDGNLQPYWDRDAADANAGPGGPAPAYLHVRLVNRSVASKAISELGPLTVIFHMAGLGWAG